MFNVASSLVSDCGIDLDMSDLAMTRETMDTFVNLHVKVVPNTQPMMVELIGVFFGQNAQRYRNVSGFTLTNR